MGKPELHVFRDPDGEPAGPTATVRLRLAQVFPLLAHAHRHNYSWLKDMADDEIIVTSDLAEILSRFDAYLQRKKGA